MKYNTAWCTTDLLQGEVLMRNTVCCLMCAFLPTLAGVSSGEQSATGKGTASIIVEHAGISPDSAQSLVRQCYERIFTDKREDDRLYFPHKRNMAYMYSKWSESVISTDQAMGMFVCVQLDRKEEFDRLWRYAKKYQYHDEGQWEGYFAYRVTTGGVVVPKKAGPWASGEAYFVTSLILADRRWGGGRGILDYAGEARALLRHFVEDADTTAEGSLFHRELKVPLLWETWGATKTVSAHHTPAFYQLWAEWSDDAEIKEFFSEAARSSREYLKKVSSHSPYRLIPMIINPDGSLNDKHGDSHHDRFHPASFGAIRQIALDHKWYNPAPWHTEFIDTLMRFFHDKGMDKAGYVYHIMSGENNTPRDETMPVSLSATIAMLADAATYEHRGDFATMSLAVPDDQSPDLSYLVSLMSMAGMCEVSNLEKTD